MSSLNMSQQVSEPTYKKQFVEIQKSLRAQINAITQLTLCNQQLKQHYHYNCNKKQQIHTFTKLEPRLFCTFYVTT